MWWLGGDNNDEEEDLAEQKMILRTRKRTALAVSIATKHVLKQSKKKPVASSM
jgi:hypothetical protein